jgi:isovaleryl-CoA dehydrogenase
MDFELPEEHQLAYESAFAFARDEIRPHNAEIERSDDFPRWMWKKLAEQGYTGYRACEWCYCYVFWGTFKSLCA